METVFLRHEILQLALLIQNVVDGAEIMFMTKQKGAFLMEIIRSRFGQPWHMMQLVDMRIVLLCTSA